jgi:glycerol-3-phosphate cytidylyltransferase-like family protein
MSKWIAVLLWMMPSVTASAANKTAGTTVLKDLQPAGTTDTKDKKNQQYDFVFEVSGNRYTCRTSPKASLKATLFVVGSDVKYEIDEDKAKLKNTAGKDAKCTVVRVEKVSNP